MEASGDMAYAAQTKGGASTGGALNADAVSNTAVSYLFWSAGLFGFCGLHRLYNGKIVSGLLWMSTLGLFGVGQLIDLAYVPAMAEARARGLRSRQYQLGTFDSAGLTQKNAKTQAAPLTLQLLKLAKHNGGRVTVTDAVLETEATFSEIETELKALVTSGYAHVGNDPVSGVVVYEIPELAVG